jgi:alpha-glucosidase/alpha-D-xyloside xylohydrolase
MGPAENRVIPPKSAMNNLLIEPIIKQYNELRYRLMPYSYTLAWEAAQKGLPMMRALWLHYPKDSIASAIGDQFLWGKDILVAPVYEKNAATRKLYLPEGLWYDWWTNKKITGASIIERSIDLATMPLYVKAGAIIPIDAIRQSTNDTTAAALTIKIYEGANGSFELYEDDGVSRDYLKGAYQLTKFSWDQQFKKLTIESLNERNKNKINRKLNVELIGQQLKKTIRYQGKKMTVLMGRS